MKKKSGYNKVGLIRREACQTSEALKLAFLKLNSTG
jgi:hypothetical protein